MVCMADDAVVQNVGLRCGAMHNSTVDQGASVSGGVVDSIACLNDGAAGQNASVCCGAVDSIACMNDGAVDKNTSVYCGTVG